MVALNIKRKKYIFFFLVFCVVFLCNFSAYSYQLNNSSDSVLFVEVEKEFNALMDTTRCLNYNKYVGVFWYFYSKDFEEISPTEYKNLKELCLKAKTELKSVRDGFNLIEIPVFRSEKVAQKLLKSKESFISAYLKLLQSIENLDEYTGYRSNIYIINFRNIKMEFEQLFNKGTLNFLQAKNRIE